MVNFLMLGLWMALGMAGVFLERGQWWMTVILWAVSIPAWAVYDQETIRHFVHRFNSDTHRQELSDDVPEDKLVVHPPPYFDDPIARAEFIFDMKESISMTALTLARNRNRWGTYFNHARNGECITCQSEAEMRALEPALKSLADYGDGILERFREMEEAGDGQGV